MAGLATKRFARGIYSSACGGNGLLQPFFGLILAGLFLHEPIAWTMIASTAVVVLCVAGAKRFA
jgi:drug/metabolite transporter (DMT)-like permease